MKVNKYDESKHAPIALIPLERTEFATNGVKKNDKKDKKNAESRQSDHNICVM
jgi:hypothetical protein